MRIAHGLIVALLTFNTIVVAYAQNQNAVTRPTDFFCATIDPVPEVNPTPEFYQLIYRNLIWKPLVLNNGSTAERMRIGVKFLNGNTSQHVTVFKWAPMWTAWRGASSIELVFLDRSENRRENLQWHIRIWFNEVPHPTRPAVGSQSEHGTIALTIPANQPTMYLKLQGLMPDASRALILHEFGHALGLLHEHFHPEFQVRFNEKKILADVMKMGWCDKKADKKAEEQACKIRISQQITSKVPPGHRCPGATKFDSTSIMMYRIFPGWIKNGKEYQPGRWINDKDLACVRNVYPRQIQICQPARSFPPGSKKGSITADTAAYNLNGYPVCSLPRESSVIFGRRNGDYRVVYAEGVREEIWVSRALVR